METPQVAAGDARLGLYWLIVPSSTVPQPEQLWRRNRSCRSFMRPYPTISLRLTVGTRGRMSEAILVLTYTSSWISETRSPLVAPTGFLRLYRRQIRALRRASPAPTPVPQRADPCGNPSQCGPLQATPFGLSQGSLVSCSCMPSSRWKGHGLMSAQPARQNVTGRSPLSQQRGSPVLRL